MAIQGTTVDVPLTVVDQVSPTSSGPVGRLKRLVNAQVTKFQDRGEGAPSAVRVDKREAFVSLTTEVRSTVNGTVQVGADLSDQTLMTEFADKLLLVAGDRPHVYSSSTVAWEAHDYQYLADVLVQDYVHTGNVITSTPDMAHAEGVHCYTWTTASDFNAGGGAPTEKPGCHFTVIDEDGVTLRANTRLDTSSTRVKVVASGGYFWIVSEKGDGTSTFKVRVVDRNGVDAASTTFAVTYTNPGYWDVTATDFGVLVAQVDTSGVGVQLSKMTYASGTITRTASTDTSINGWQGLAFLTNDVDPGRGYLGTVEHVGTDDNTIRVYRVLPALTQDHVYTVATGQADQVANISGYVEATTLDVVVAFSILDDSLPVQTLNNIVRQYRAPLSGSSTHLSDLRSMNVASRAFARRGRYYYVGYYPSKITQITGTEELTNQPTLFLCPLDATQNVAGRFEALTAYAEWQAPGSKYNFHLASAVETFHDGLRFPVSYRAQSFTSSRQQVSGDVGTRVTTQASTVGVKAYSLTTQLGRSVQHGTDMLLPGPMAVSWSGGEFSESNVNLAPELPTAVVTPIVSGTGLVQGLYQFVVVYEWTDENGERVRSAPSPALNVDVATDNKYIALTGRMLHASNKRDVLISIYRTDMLPESGGTFTPSTIHYKITVDAPTIADDPLYNDNNQSIWQFDDQHNEITANEILYTDKGQLPNYPAPPFSTGCKWRDRMFVVGYDNAIWFSSAPTEGDALWFHPALRLVLPTQDRIRAIAATTEDYLLVLCESSIWYFPATLLPDSSGANGTLPSGIELKFNMGCVGDAVVTRAGCAYASSAGGVWIVTRDLRNVWLSEPLADALDGPVSSLAIDGRQRLYATLGGTIGVYDGVSSCWYEWGFPTTPQLLTSYQGAITYADGARIWKQATGNYVDIQISDDAPTLIPYYVDVELAFLHLGGIRNYKRIWSFQLGGQAYTDCTITTSIAYDDNLTVVETKSKQVETTTALVVECLPRKQLCSSIGLRFTESTTGDQEPGRGFSMEVVSLYVGLEKGLNRVAISTRT